MPQPHGTGAQFGSDDIPLSVHQRHLYDALHTIAAVICKFDLITEVNLSTSVNDSVIQLTVLIAGQTLVVKTLFFKNLAAECAERHRVHITVLSGGAELGVTYSEAGREHLRNACANGGS